MIKRQRRCVLVLSAAILAITLLHRALPTDSLGWHGWHVIAERLYYLPILVAAARLGPAGTVGITLLATFAYLSHIALDWDGQRMVQAEQIANLGTFWLVGLLASFLFHRWKRALSEVASAHEDTLAALAGSLELREPYTSGHSERVRDYTLLLAQRLGIQDKESLRLMAGGALFHDVGKIGIPDAILLKEAALTSEEERIMRRHPELGADLVGQVELLQEARDMVLSHHERFDGGGYPEGRRSSHIPLGARIFAVADAFDAMTSDRPYRAALSFEEAVARIAQGRGSQFDPAVVDAFLSVGFERWDEIAKSTGIRLRRSVPTADRTSRGH